MTDGGTEPVDTGASLGYADTRAVSDLLLDQQNPRLPEGMSGASQEELAVYIDSHYDPLRIAESIAKKGFFPSEPLIVLEGLNIVLEGNRRLVALKGLVDSSLRAKFEEADEWNELASSEAVPSVVPVVVVKHRSDAAAVIGFRHISGIEPWDPLPKARFIAGLLEGGDGIGFDEVADLVGETQQSVRSQYRNYAAVREMADLGVDTRRIGDRFGTFTRAMQNAGIRGFVGLVPPGAVAVGQTVLLEPDPDRLAELSSWLFGTDDGVDPVLSDSRQITDLGHVLASADGIDELRATRDLSAAFEASGGPLQRLLNRLSQARNALNAAGPEIDVYRENPAVADLLEECRAALEQLQ